MSYKNLKLKLRVFKAGHIVAMATCYIERMTATGLLMIRNFYDNIIVASLVKQWWYSFFTAYLVSAGNYCQPPYVKTTLKYN